MQTVLFILAVAVVSAGIFALMTRADRISDRIVRGRRASSDSGSSSTNDGWVASWFGPTHSADISGRWDNDSWRGGDGGQWR
jgi:hypothetical protein